MSATLIRWFVLLVAALVPLMPIGSGGPDPTVFPGWPDRFEGRTLVPLPLTPGERSFAGAFPGRMAKFSDGSRTIALRWITRPSNKLHPPPVCYRAFGFRVEPLPPEADAAGPTWARFRATRAAEHLEVRYRIRDAAGRTWLDESAWYWEAQLGRTSGPWWAETVAVALTS